ncbi:MAG: sigma 54-interacting transcriptional regulator [Bdellovibrionaceae bacterium]|nr:sigma 54-interacting transcriptional regulator [Pseudobdellovibrionaceae bacterium]
MTTKLLPIINETENIQRAFIQIISPHHTQIFQIDELSVLGRDYNCQILLDDSFVSNRHARITHKDRSYCIQDLRSRNGTFVNGTRILEAQLKDKDRIQIGKQELIFSLEIEEKPTQLGLTSRNKTWNQQLENLPHMAQKDFPVLITGASGTGKEILAKMIHRYSQRSYGPFVSVNCSALSENLVESELFGHIKGSFTGAEQNRKGAFESARNGTLFLDEIGDLPLSLQPKLLRALENSEIKPVGSDSSILTDVRIIAATHNTLSQKVNQEKFRQDLFYRLNVLKITPPPLKERMEDFENFLYFFGKQYRVAFSFSAIQRLKEHEWPGNIRELKNFVARASALYNKTIVQEDCLDLLLDKNLPVLDSIEKITTENMNLKDVEKILICRALIKNHGNQRKSANQLGLPKSTLNDRIKNYKIDIDQLLQEGSRLNL